MSTNYSTAKNLLRQTPGGSGVWGEYRFVIDEGCEEADYWVIYDDVPCPQRGRCDARHMVFVSAEPPSLRRYPRRFLSQFFKVVTCHRGIKHPNVTHSQQGLPWHVGGPAGVQSYEELCAVDPQKTRCLSVITSNKALTRGHHRRLRFVQELKARLGDGLDVYGRGIREVADKWEAIASYRYHIVIENSAVPDYWTEKLADAYLGRAYPFYIGSPNIGSYFPDASLTTLDIEDVAGAAAVINRTIAKGLCDTNREAITRARELVLHEYNLFAMLARTLATLPPGGARSDAKVWPLRDFEGPVTRLKRHAARLLPRFVRRALK